MVSTASVESRTQWDPGMGGPWRALQHPLRRDGDGWGGFLGAGGSCGPQSHDDLLEGAGLQLPLGFLDVPQVNPPGNSQCQGLCCMPQSVVSPELPLLSYAQGSHRHLGQGVKQLEGSLARVGCCVLGRAGGSNLMFELTPCALAG